LPIPPRTTHSPRPGAPRFGPFAIIQPDGSLATGNLAGVDIGP